MPVLETYLRKLVHRRGATVAETAHYDLLKALLDDVGATLTPKVYALIHPHNVGEGIPDLALYDEQQPTDTRPSRGVVEAKGTSADLMATANSEQTRRYTLGYGVTLVTNLYQFVIVTRAGEGVTLEERYDLAPNEAAFYTAAAHPRAIAEAHEKSLTEYLMRAMRRVAPLTSPQDVAWMLASYARQARALIERSDADLTTLEHMRDQLGKALGIGFESEDAEAFFRSTLVQTLFYGVFSAWVLWHESGAKAEDRFDLWQDVRGLNVPVIQEIFYEISKPALLRPLGLETLLEWTAEALNRVDRIAFFDRFERGNAVQYFYEPFLEAFDPELRRQLGVWYTPPEVVEYMVARVDAALKSDLGIADGLADPNVYVLDPCCGTGAYLVGALRQIYATLKNRDGEALAAQATAKAMRERVYGFEILPAPFVVAHLQIGMLLNSLHAPLKKGERAGVYLTNALTGWKELPSEQLDLPGLEMERKAAAYVKRKQRILVILGNPPYSSFAGLAVNEEAELSNAYRTARRAPQPQGQGLNDLYVRFYRMAERRIVEETGQGVVCFISNYSWLDGLSHTGMRERYLDKFDKIYVDNLHGDRIISEYAPDGRTSETVFAMQGSSVGIRIGTQISLMIRKDGESQASLLYRDMDQARAAERRAALLESLKTPDFDAQYTLLYPVSELGLPFKPRTVGAKYMDWHRLPDLFPTSFPGVKTSRDDVLVDIDENRLKARMSQYFDAAISHEQLGRMYPGLMDSNARYKANMIREALISRGILEEQFVRYAYRPFDTRSLYWERETKLLDEKRADYFPNVAKNNPVLVTQQKPRRDWSLPQVITAIGCLDLMDRGASCFPLRLKDNYLGFNLSEIALAYIERLGVEPETLFYHALSVLHAPAYRIENAGALQQDWARIPLPEDADLLRHSAALGQRLAELLDPEQPVSGVTQGDPLAELAGIAVLTTVGGQAPDFALTAGWGYAGRGGIVMPGQGRIGQRDDGAIDVYLNDSTWWRNVPADVWSYTLGGYQVLKKWLSYREKRVLGRDLKPEEAREFMHIARRITAILAMNDGLNGSYRNLTADP